MKKMLFFILIFVSLTSCSQNRQESTEGLPGSTLSNNSTWTTSPKKTQESILAMTITPSPFSVPQTPTLSIPTPSTLDPESAATLQGFPSDIEECEHPCWNGLTPGSSGGLLVPAFFASLGIDYTTLPNIEVSSTEGLLGTYSFFRRNELDTALEMIEVTWSDKVELIQLWYTRSPNLLGEDAFLHPASLLDSLGNPSETLIHVEQGTRYLVFLDFPDRKTAILFSGFVTQNNPSDANICISDPEGAGITVSLYSKDVMPFSPIGLDANADYLIEQEMYTGLDREKFLLTLKDISRCIPVEPRG